MKIYKDFLIILVLIQVSAFTSISIAQTKVKVSTIVSDINKKKKQNPKMTDQQLANFANQLLAKQGFNYNFEMSELFFQKTPRKEFPETQKEQIIKFPFEFSLVNNGKRKFELTAKHNLQNECYDESTPAFPITQATENQATVIINSNPMAVKIPKTFSGQTLFWVDSKTRSKVLQKWIFPYSFGLSEESFIGFSDNGQKLLVTVEDAYIYDYDTRQKVKELALEISSNGKLRFVSTASVKKKFNMDLATGNLSENIKADKVFKITIGSKTYYIAVPDTSC